jgi:inhibitor of cysteine peptidase
MILRTVPEITVLIICLVLAMLPTAVYAAPDTTDQEKMITENNNGNSIDLKKGHAFYLKLSENPSTGYSWQLSVGNGLNLLSDRYHPFESSKSSKNFVVGAGGFHLWRIEAAAKGSQQIKAVYKRPWEPETGREQTFTLNVVVV